MFSPWQRRGTRPLKHPLFQQGDAVQPPMLLLTKYLDELGAGPVVTTPAPEAAKSLPVFVSQTYELHRANLFGRDYSLLLVGAENGQLQPRPRST